MNLYLAPMEEITGYVYRNTLNKFFPYVDKYFTPFITPNQNKLLKTREGREIIPEHNKGLYVVPQVLTNNAEYFNDLARTLEDLGYNEINLNFGCPSNTVVKKYKGSGILRDTDMLERFLDGVFEGEGKNIKISVKTRVGYTTDEYFDDIVNIYNKYPIYELIIHPRIQKDFYNGKPRMETFDLACDKSVIPLCYNGDIWNKEDYDRIVSNYSHKGNVSSVMIGRGAIGNPGIFKEIKTGERPGNGRLFEFLEELYEYYCQEFGPKDGLYKMKEVWSFFMKNFDGIEKEIKIIRKTSLPSEYKTVVRQIKSRYS